MKALVRLLTALALLSGACGGTVGATSDGAADAADTAVTDSLPEDAGAPITDVCKAPDGTCRTECRAVLDLVDTINNCFQSGAWWCTPTPAPSDAGQCLGNCFVYVPTGELYSAPCSVPSGPHWRACTADELAAGEQVGTACNPENLPSDTPLQ